VEEGEAEIREERPHGAPAPGEDAGPTSEPRLRRCR
jgi:hypothetical protein